MKNSRWNKSKAQYAGYAFKAPTDGSFSFDIDQVIQVLGKDGYYRFLCLEIKHINENFSKIENQVKTIAKFKRPGIPTIVCVFNPKNADLVDGKITDSSGKLFDTRTAWYETDDLIVKAVYDDETLSKLINRAVMKGKVLKLKELINLIKEHCELFPTLYKWKWEEEEEVITVGEAIKEFFTRPLTPIRQPTEFDRMFAAMEEDRADYWNYPNHPLTKLEEHERNLNWEW